MSKPGPKPKPTKLRVLEGDHHKSRYNLNEPQFAAFTAPMPAHIAADPVAAELWRSIVPKLDRVGIISDAEVTALELLCVTYSLWRQEPSDNKSKRLQSMLSEFGLTPSSRSRIVGALPHEEESPMERIRAR